MTDLDFIYRKLYVFQRFMLIMESNTFNLEYFPQLNEEENIMIKLIFDDHEKEKPVALFKVMLKTLEEYHMELASLSLIYKKDVCLLKNILVTVNKKYYVFEELELIEYYCKIENAIISIFC